MDSPGWVFGGEEGVMDYRTWWRKEIDEVESIGNALSVRSVIFPESDCPNKCVSCLFDDFTDFGAEADEDNEDCMDEQLWAVNEGLA